MPGRWTMEAIFLLKCLMERYKDKYFMHGFVDLEKAYDIVLKLRQCHASSHILFIDFPKSRQSRFALGSL